MTGPDEQPTNRLTARRTCLVDGCACRDTRILSIRRATFFAVRARTNGQFADRALAAEPDWRLPADATR